MTETYHLDDGTEYYLNPDLCRKCKGWDFLMKKAGAGRRGVSWRGVDNNHIFVNSHFYICRHYQNILSESIFVEKGNVSFTFKVMVGAKTKFKGFKIRLLVGSNQKQVKTYDKRHSNCRSTLFSFKYFIPYSKFMINRELKFSVQAKGMSNGYPRRLKEWAERGKRYVVGYIDDELMA